MSRILDGEEGTDVGVLALLVWPSRAESPSLVARARPLIEALELLEGGEDADGGGDAND